LKEPLADIARTLTIAHSNYIKNGRAVKLLLQPLGQALASGVSDLQLSIELQDMIASLKLSDTAVTIDDTEDITTESDNEQTFESWVTSMINFCKKHVLKQRRT
jgi:hypothetical protein